MNTMPKDKLNQITVASHFRVNKNPKKKKKNKKTQVKMTNELIKTLFFLFKNSLAELLEKMKDAEPLFVRYASVLETIFFSFFLTKY